MLGTEDGGSQGRNNFAYGLPQNAIQRQAEGLLGNIPQATGEGRNVRLWSPNLAVSLSDIQVKGAGYTVCARGQGPVQVEKEEQLLLVLRGANGVDPANRHASLMPSNITGKKVTFIHM